jgi:hypothetical protein
MPLAADKRAEMQLNDIPFRVMLLLLLAGFIGGCEGLTFDTRLRPTDAGSSEGSTIRGCGGAGPLAYRGEAASPGDPCGLCADGILSRASACGSHDAASADLWRPMRVDTQNLSVAEVPFD